MVGETGLLGFIIGASVATFFSPCVYAMLPAYLGYTAHDVTARMSTYGVIKRSVAGAFGAITAFILLGGLALLLGDTLRGWIPAIELSIGLILVIIGVSLVVGRYPHITVPIPRPSGTVLGFTAFGAGYALAGAGCVAPVFFAVVVSAAAAPTSVGIGIILLYAGTFAALLVAATFVAAAGVELATARVGAIAARLTPIAGGVIIVAGFTQIAIGIGWIPPLY